MPGRERTIVPLLAAALVLAAAVVPGARAETNYYELICRGGGGSMLVDVRLTMNEPMSTERWQGWVLARKTLADCAQTEICDVQPFPAVDDTIQVEDPTAVPNTAYAYTFLLVDAQGQRVVPYEVPDGGPDPTWGGRGDVGSVGVALYAVGTIRGYMCPGMALVSPCTDTCWANFWVEGSDLCDHVDEVVAVYGYGLSYGIEGPILTFDHWEPSACPPVPTVPMNWGTLKQRYR